MAESLGELIIRRMKDLGIRNNSELARLIKRSDAYVGDLINDRGKTKSGTYTPRPETLANLSKVLEIPEMEILTAIGYTSQKNSPEIPESVKEAFAREGRLTKKDEILLAGMIETLKKQNQEAEEPDKQETKTKISGK